ncbi:hypothetical protein AVEN_271759-1 [Araneus ventricosus]|uniref:Uncharacterized protein n=1 Tax=Araneus ventricosus TaxID=182803 RepID=A0A4Y2UYV5_ARAVE|nr:hypothetical protein AVEN_271759-1 [Araneus ventricosus]
MIQLRIASLLHGRLQKCRRGVTGRVLSYMEDSAKCRRGYREGSLSYREDSAKCRRGYRKGSLSYMEDSAKCRRGYRATESSSRSSAASMRTLQNHIRITGLKYRFYDYIRKENERNLLLAVRDSSS